MPTSMPGTTLRAAPSLEAVVTKNSAATLLLCGATLIFEGYDIYVYGAVVPQLLQHESWSLSPAFAGVIGSAAVMGMLIGALLTGLLTDILGRRRMFIAAMAVFSIGMGLSAIAPTPELLLASRVIVGLGGGGFMPTAIATIVEFSPPHKRNFNVSLALSGVGIGGVGAALLGMWALPLYGYQFMFGLGVLPLFTLLPFLVVKLPESVSFLIAKRREADARENIRRHRLPVELREKISSPTEQSEMPVEGSAVKALFSKGLIRGTMVFWLATALCMVLMFGANTWLPTLMMKAGFGITSSMSFLVALNVGAVAGSLIGAGIADRVGPRPVILVGFACSVAALVALAFQPPPLAIYPLVVLVGFGAAGTQNIINSYIGIFYPARIRGTGLGLALAFGRFGGMLGPIYGGLLVAAGVGTRDSFLAFALPALLALLVMIFGPRLGKSTTAGL